MNHTKGRGIVLISTGNVITKEESFEGQKLGGCILSKIQRVVQHREKPGSIQAPRHREDRKESLPESRSSKSSNFKRQKNCNRPSLQNKYKMCKVTSQQVLEKAGIRERNPCHFLSYNEGGG